MPKKRYRESGQSVPLPPSPCRLPPQNIVHRCSVVRTLAAPREGQPAKMADSPTVDAVLHNAVIVTMDGALRVLRDGAVAVTGDRIAAVGPSADVLAAFPCAVQTLDLGGRIVLPGRCLAACSAA